MVLRRRKSWDLTLCLTNYFYWTHQKQTPNQSYKRTVYGADWLSLIIHTEQAEAPIRNYIYIYIWIRAKAQFLNQKGNRLEIARNWP